MESKKYYSDGQIESVKWLNKNGELDRQDGPAYIRYRRDGSMIRERWYKDGRPEKVILRLRGDMYTEKTYDIDGRLEETRTYSGVLVKCYGK